MTRLDALAYINNKKNGYISELVTEISQEFVDEFITIGFITYGYTLTAKTWKVTSLGKEFYTELKF